MKGKRFKQNEKTKHFNLFSKKETKKEIKKVIKNKTKNENKLTTIMTKHSHIFIIVVLIFLLAITPTVSRYIGEMVSTYLQAMNNFYFHSDLLTERGESYKLYNWNGISDYDLNIDLWNHEDKIRFTSTDIEYEVKVETDNKSDYTINGNTGKITADQAKNQSFNVKIKPTTQLNSGDYVDVKITVTSSKPYEKTMYASFKIYVNVLGVNYSITDKENSKFFDVNIANASDTDKTITLKWDYTQYVINTLEERLTNNITEDVNGVSHVKQTQITIPAKQSYSVRFYKNDITKDNSYPNFEGNSVVTIEE